MDWGDKNSLIETEDDDLELLYGELEKKETKIDSKLNHTSVSYVNSSVTSESLKLGNAGKATPYHSSKPSNTGYEGKVSYVKDEWGASNEDLF